jgi:hypothetical protein
MPSALAAAAAPTQDVELTDGSIVRAEVISLENGTYTVRSHTLGEIEIPADQIRSIATQQHAASVNSVSDTAQLDGIREALITDPVALNKIKSLQNDPLVQTILDDQVTMRAISTGDMSTLMNDPKIKALMEHSTVQELTQGVSH